jgi:hypothetical protein
MAVFFHNALPPRAGSSVHSTLAGWGNCRGSRLEVSVITGLLRQGTHGRGLAQQMSVSFSKQNY